MTPHGKPRMACEQVSGIRSVPGVGRRFVSNFRRNLVLMLVVASPFGCDPEPSPPGEPQQSLAARQLQERPEMPPIVGYGEVPQLPAALAIGESVFWEPDDSLSLRERIAMEKLANQRSVLEIGTGTGLISLCCLQHGAIRVIATDINPAAVATATHNAEQLGFADRLEVRLVPRRNPSAYSVVAKDEKFDLIISNPPWENQKPTTVADFALYDPGFELMKSLIRDGRKHLKPNGRILLAYGCVTAIREIEKQASEHHFSFRILDDRDLGMLPEVFLPGMLIELTTESTN